MESYANDMLDNGWPIPVPANFTRYILKEKVTPLDGFLLIDGDADFAQNITIGSSLSEESTLVKRMLTASGNDYQLVYELVEQVMVWQLQQGEIAVDDTSTSFEVIRNITRWAKAGKVEQSVTGRWTREMRNELKEVMGKIEDGSIEIKRIQMGKVLGVGKKVVSAVENGKTEKYRKIKEKGKKSKDKHGNSGKIKGDY